MAKISAMAARRQPPTVRLRRLGNVLARLREGAGLTLAFVTERTGIDRTTLYRIEKGLARPQKRTLTALLDLYDVPAADREDLFTLARPTTEKSWLQSFPEALPQPYRAYIGLEGEAELILNYESLFMPGLLQTEDYARAALQAGALTAPPCVVERLVEARMSRQAVLSRTPPLRLWAIVDEGALRRPVGGRDAMRAQLKYLAESAEVPHVTFQVIPYDVGPHPGMAGSFAVMRFGEPAASDVVYVEGQGNDLFLEGEAEIRRFNRIFEHLRALALSPTGSVEWIRKIAREQSA
jgi:transcriptional regulator with XRE-family HTH domain